MDQDPDVKAAMDRLEMRELLDRSSLGSAEAKEAIARGGQHHMTEPTTISKTTYTFTVLAPTSYGEMTLEEALERPTPATPWVR